MIEGVRVTEVRRRIYQQRGYAVVTELDLIHGAEERLTADFARRADALCAEKGWVRGPVKAVIAPWVPTDDLGLRRIGFRFDYVKRPPRAAREKFAECLARRGPISFRREP